MAGDREVGRRPPRDPQPLRDSRPTRGADAVPTRSDRDLVKTGVSHIDGARLAVQEATIDELPDVWDLWYVCFRLWRSAGDLGIAGVRTRSGCPACRELVTHLVS